MRVLSKRRPPKRLQSTRRTDERGRRCNQSLSRSRAAVIHLYVCFRAGGPCERVEKEVAKEVFHPVIRIRSSCTYVRVCALLFAETLFACHARTMEKSKTFYGIIRTYIYIYIRIIHGYCCTYLYMRIYIYMYNIGPLGVNSLRDAGRYDIDFPRGVPVYY